MVRNADGGMWSYTLWRTGYSRWQNNIESVADLKAVIRAADRAYGSARLVLWMDDGECLCHECARSEFRSIASAIANKTDNGWRATDAEMDTEIDTYLCCAHCNKPIGYDEWQE